MEVVVKDVQCRRALTFNLPPTNRVALSAMDATDMPMVSIILGIAETGCILMGGH